MGEIECTPATPFATEHLPILRIDMLHSHTSSLGRLSACYIIVGAMLLSLYELSLAQEPPTAEQVAFFEAKIRPVLIEHCYKCHSADAAAKGELKGGLYLDHRQGLIHGGDSGPAVQSDDAAGSLILSAMRYEGIEMPPAGKLPESILDDFTKWVQWGAPDPRADGSAPTTKLLDIEAGKRFWSLQPIQRESLSEIARTVSGHPVDHFIRKELSERGLTPSSFADHRTLIRRAWFDLLGLPPSVEELESWMTRLSADTTATNPINRQAWDDLLSHLLERPEYGERWARHWMDVARFAESFGYEQDYDRPTAYHYRDFLIQAFNSDLSYQQFVEWQIAGDELEPSNPLAWMATGFLGAGAFPTQLTETEFESTRYNELDDMTATTGVAFLGLSIGCARCHDHKFDPIAAEDYYRVAAAFTSAIRTEKTFDLTPEENAKIRDDFTRELRSTKEKLATYEAGGLDDEFALWLKSKDITDPSSLSWLTLSGDLSTRAGSIYQAQSDGSFLGTGNKPNQETLTFTSKPFQTSAKSIRIEALSDPSLPHQGPGRADNGNFALGNISVEQIDANGEAKKIALRSARATHEQNNSSLSVAASIDSDPISGWAVDGQIGKSQAAVFEFSESIALSAETKLRVILEFNHPNPRHAIGRVRFSVTDRDPANPEVGSQAPPADVLTALHRLAREESPSRQSDDWKIGRAWFQTTSKTWQSLKQRETELERDGPKLQLAKVLVTSEGLPHLPHHADDRGYPHFYPETHLLRRGDVEQKVRVVEPGFPKVFARFASTSNDLAAKPPVDGNTQSSYRRAALAKWITDPQSGAGELVARVMVNRLWQHHFGQGIVATPNDFGFAGQPPTHPELLDLLAMQLIDSGWKLKTIHKWIMSSETYMQGNKELQDPRESLDPENRYLWHRSPRRLEAEAIRDSMLFVSGQLDRRMYGPGTLDSNMKRRSVYFFIKRSQLIPTMMLFDWPEHLVSIGQRQSTTIAPQALMFMNSEQGRSYAEAFARSVASEDATKSIEAAYRRALGRRPSEREAAVAVQFIESSKNSRAQLGESNANESGLADFCQAIFGLNEFIYID